jgi:putative colanic acid biosynthesis acetyltransferase WcaF
MEVLNASEAGSRHGGPSFPLSNRIRRVLWALAWQVLARWTPPPLHPWRVLVLRLFGIRAGRNCRIHASAMVWDPANLELGDNVLIGPGATLYNQGRIAIGAGSVISQRAHLCASSHRIGDRHFQLVLKPIAIGANCWVAAEAFVGPGVTMADGAVLSARGALFDDAAADTVYRGNPAVAVARRRYEPGEDALA